MSIKNVLKLCDKRGLVKPAFNGSSVDCLKFGPVGEYLVNNVRQEWLLSNVTSREDNVFPILTPACPSGDAVSDIKDTYMHVKNLCSGQLPFGIAHTIFDSNSSHFKVNDTPQPHAVFDPTNKTYLRSLLFVSLNDGRQKFYSWQQKRKMWWRKFSSQPGRFSLSDIREASVNDAKSPESCDLNVNILADFGWGSTIIETIRLSPLGSLDIPEELLDEFKVKDGRKLALPCIVECILSVEVASLVFLCDAFSDHSERQLLRLHRRLAPFKAGFVASLKDSSVADRLRDVASHISGQLRQNGLSTLLLPDFAKKSLDSQLSRNDEIGIPFTIVLSDSTLSDGIVRLYSRETTLKEQVHISRVPQYVELLVKNY